MSKEVIKYVAGHEVFTDNVIVCGATFIETDRLFTLKEENTSNYRNVSRWLGIRFHKCDHLDMEYLHDTPKASLEHLHTKHFRSLKKAQATADESARHMNDVASKIEELEADDA